MKRKHENTTTKVITVTLSLAEDLHAQLQQKEMEITKLNEIIIKREKNICVACEEPLPECSACHIKLHLTKECGLTECDVCAVYLCNNCIHICDACGDTTCLVCTCMCNGGCNKQICLDCAEYACPKH